MLCCSQFLFGFYVSSYRFSSDYRRNSWSNSSTVSDILCSVWGISEWLALTLYLFYFIFESSTWSSRFASDHRCNIILYTVVYNRSASFLFTRVLHGIFLNLDLALCTYIVVCSHALSLFVARADTIIACSNDSFWDSYGINL